MESIWKKQAGNESTKPIHMAQGIYMSGSRGRTNASGIDDSPLMVAQRRKLQSMFGKAIQLQRAEEEPLNGKFETAQRVEKEESTMGKLGSIMQMYSETKTTSSSDISELADARRNDFPHLGTSSHNYAVEKGKPITWAGSNIGGHSESRASSNALGLAIGGNYTLNLLSERQPCGECENVLRDVEETTNDAVKVKTKYLVDYGANNVPDTLRALYEPYRDESNME